MNERRRRRLQQLASGAALLGATAVLPGCEKHVPVNAPLPTPPAQVAPLPEPVEPIGARMVDAGAPLRTPAQLNAPMPLVDAGLPLRTPAQLNAPLPMRDAGVVPQPIHLNSPPRKKPE
jgi:hypothetical protein